MSVSEKLPFPQKLVKRVCTREREGGGVGARVHAQLHGVQGRRAMCGEDRTTLGADSFLHFSVGSGIDLRSPGLGANAFPTKPSPQTLPLSLPNVLKSIPMNVDI